MKFKQVQEAWEILQDANERAWYDGHKEAILSGKTPAEHVGTGGQGCDDPELGINLFAYFTTACYSDFSDNGDDSFYRVYGDVFDTIQQTEPPLEEGEMESRSTPPSFGDSQTEYSEVRAFYAYYFDFTSRRSFQFKELYNLNAAGNRMAKRDMEKENQRARREGRKEHNKAIIKLAEYVKKKDPRVAAEAKRKEEREKAKEEEDKRKKQELEEFKSKLREEQRQKELLRMQEQAERVKELYGPAEGEEAGEEEVEYYECVACAKTFKSEKAFQNHEASKKHKSLVADLKRELMLEEQLMRARMGEVDEEEDTKGKGGKEEKVVFDVRDLQLDPRDEQEDDDESFLALLTDAERKAELKRRKRVQWEEQQEQEKKQLGAIEKEEEQEETDAGEDGEELKVDLEEDDNDKVDEEKVDPATLLNKTRRELLLMRGGLKKVKKLKQAMKENIAEAEGYGEKVKEKEEEEIVSDEDEGTKKKGRKNKKAGGVDKKKEKASEREGKEGKEEKEGKEGGKVGGGDGDVIDLEDEGEGAGWQDLYSNEEYNVWVAAAGTSFV